MKGSFSAGFSYTYDPCDSKINNYLGDNYVLRWKSTPNEPESNVTYKLCPMILIRNTDGVHRTTKVTARIWEANIGGTLKNYYVDNKWGDHCVCLQFKNHK